MKKRLANSILPSFGCARVFGMPTPPSNRKQLFLPSARRSAEVAASVLIRSWSPACSDSGFRAFIRFANLFSLSIILQEDRVAWETQAQRFPVAGSESAWKIEYLTSGDASATVSCCRIYRGK